MGSITSLSIVKALTHTFEDQIYLPDATDQAIKDFYQMRQRKHESLQAYHDRYLAQVQVLAEIGVKLVPPTVIRHVADKNGHAGVVTATDRAEANERYIAVCFLQSVRQRHAIYLDHLRNSFLDGQSCIHPPCTKLITSYNEDLPLRHSRNCQELMEWLSPKLQARNEIRIVSLISLVSSVASEDITP
jgi:hypothetical protein